MNDLPVLVLFEDGSAELERVALIIAESLRAQGREVRCGAASAVSIPDILASGLFVLGAEKPSSPSYAELARVFKGVNLAGRKAAFFGSSGAATAWLRSICADTDLFAATADLAARRIEGAAIGTWLRGLN